MAFNVNKYLPKKKRNVFDFLRFCYLKNKRKKHNLSKGFKSFCFVIGKIVAGLFLLLLVLILFFLALTWYESNHKYSIAMPKIAGYFLDDKDSFSASGLYTISSKEKDEEEKSASLLYGTIDCYYKYKYCKEELVSIMNFGGIMILPHIWKYDIIYRDKDRLIYSDGYKTSVVVDLNQKTITKTITKTFMQETPKTQIDEFITDPAEIDKEEKRVIRKYLKHKFWLF